MLGSGRNHLPGRQVLGIDIGPGNIKGIVIAEDPSVQTVTHAIRLPTPDGAVINEVVVNSGEVGAALRKLVKQTGIHFTSATVTVPAEQSLIRWVDLPVMDEASLRAAATFEGRKYLNYPPEEAEIQILPNRKQHETDGTMMKALFVAAPRDTVRSRAEAIEAAGLSVNCLEPEPFALMRALHKHNLKQEMLWNSHSWAYLQLGEQTSSMYVLQQGELRFVRAIPWGGRRLTQAIMDDMDCNESMARSIKEDQASYVDEGGALIYQHGGLGQSSTSLTSELDRLCREIQRLMSYYQSLYAEGSYEGILNEVTLCGGTAGLSGFAQYLEARLDIDFDTTDPFNARALRLAPGISETIEGYRTGYSVAIGLALGELQHSRSAAVREAEVEYIWRRNAQLGMIN